MIRNGFKTLFLGDFRFFYVIIIDGVKKILIQAKLLKPNRIIPNEKIFFFPLT